MPPPLCFWTVPSRITPVDAVLRRVLAYGYCHHIERLMVLGNIMALMSIHPDEVYRWFMEHFIDAYDWVMVPNVYGMSQFADVGLMSSKPYVFSSRYIQKMSDFLEGEWCPIWGALYWRFLHQHRNIFEKDPRITPILSRLSKMGESELGALLGRAEEFLVSIGACRIEQQFQGKDPR